MRKTSTSLQMMVHKKVITLRWFDRLWNVTPEQREQYELSSWGNSIHWPELDEDLSLEGFYTYNKDEIENQK